PRGPDDPRQRRDGVPLQGLVRRDPRARGLRAPDPDGHGRRPVAVHQVRRDRAAVGDLHAAARQPAAGRAVRRRFLRPGVGQAADLAVPLAPAARVRPFGLASPASGFWPAAGLSLCGARYARVSWRIDRRPLAITPIRWARRAMALSWVTRISVSPRSRHSVSSRVMISSLV